MTKRRQK